MNGGTSAGAIHAKASDKLRAIVIPGLAKLVDEVGASQRGSLHHPAYRFTADAGRGGLSCRSPQRPSAARPHGALLDTCA